MLHHPGYRAKFADNLKRELPRIPLAPNCDHSPDHGQSRDREGSVDAERRAESVRNQRPVRGSRATSFRAFAKAGNQLAKLHIEYESLEEWPLEWLETPGQPLSYVVQKMRLSMDKKSIEVNDSLTLAGIPREVFEYRLGNRSALEWVFDQYRVKEDNRTSIRSDPNNPDDPEYIVRLVGRSSESAWKPPRSSLPSPSTTPRPPTHHPLPPEPPTGGNSLFPAPLSDRKAGWPASFGGGGGDDLVGGSHPQRIGQLPSQSIFGTDSPANS